MDSIKKLFVSSMISSVILIIVGLFLVIRPESTLSLISYVLGGILVIIGTTSLVNYYKDKNSISTFELTYGILSLIAGLVIILNPKALVSLIPFVLGVWILISSLMKLKYVWDLNDTKNKSWITSLIITILMLILGIILVFNPFSGAVAITRMIGIFVIIYAVLDMVQSSIIKKNVKKAVKKVKKIKKVIED